MTHEIATVGDRYAAVASRGRGTRFRVCILCAATLMGTTVPELSATRFHTYTEQYKKPPFPANAIAATYLGGEGTEWFAEAEFQQDGTLVVAGTSISAPLQVGGFLEPEVIGADAPAPQPEAQDSRGGTVKPGWRHPNCTAFVLRLSPDLQDVLSFVRFPWKSGSATDVCCDTNGNIYVVGMAGPSLSRVGPCEDISAEPTTGTTGYIAKLDPKASRVLWVRTFADAGNGPRVRSIRENEVQVEAGWLYVLDADGKRKHVTQLQKVRKYARGVNPVDYTYALGSYWMTGTGREPWKRPWLRIGLGGGKEYWMYDWPGHFVGIDSLRLVSDSDVRKLFFDDEGILYLVGWSDGGNTVFEQEPCDIRQGVPYSGLGFSSWGAGALSLCHLVKIDTTAARVKGKTLWCAFLIGKESPNSLWVNHIDVATDKSVLIAGNSAHWLIQTGNSLHKGDALGPYVAVMRHDFGSLRYCSASPACGQVEVRDGDGWGSASRVIKGRHMVAFVSSATDKEHLDKSGPVPAPTLKAIQPNCAGGSYDGYIILLDLGEARDEDQAGASNAKAKK